jgi:sugar phosphate permease
MHKQFSLHWAWIILATCFVNLFINYSVRLGYGVILPEMVADLKFSRTESGTIYNAYLFTYIALTPVTGYLTDRLGARRVIASCALILALGVLCMGTVQSLWSACLFYGIAGIGSTGMWTSVITVVQRWFTLKRRGMALGILSTGYGLGFASMGAFFPLIVHFFDWRYAWYFLGAGALIMGLVNGLLLRNSPESSGYLPWGEHKESHGSSIEPRSSQKKASLIDVFKTKNFWLIGFSYFCIAYSLYGVTTFMVDYGKYDLGMPIKTASLLATVHGLSQILGVLSIVPLSDYWGRKKTISISNACIMLTILGLFFLGHYWVVLFLLIGFMAIFYGATFPMYGACAGDYFPRELMGTVIGAMTPFYGLGAICVHWVSGMIHDWTATYHLSFLLNAVMAGTGLLLMSLVSRHKT